jgi:hypothetical protein
MLCEYSPCACILDHQIHVSRCVRFHITRTYVCVRASCSAFAHCVLYVCIVAL